MLVFYTAAFMLLAAAGLAHAEPTMTVNTYYEIDPIDGFAGIYTVTNTSPQNPDYEMDIFILPAGSNQGVSGALAPENWTFDINLDETIFSTTLSYIPPVNGQGTFELYSNILDVDQRDAIAYTVPNEQFNPVSVDVPVERTLTADIYFDGIVNFKDFAMLAGEWMQVEDWYEPPVTCDGNCPVMSIQSDSAIADYDEFDPDPHPGNELLISYLVSNDSVTGEHNNMINFTLPAGSDEGVYVAAAPSGWNITINTVCTLFEGNGSVITPGSEGLFQLYSTDLNIHQDFAEADAVGPEQSITFDPVQVDVPGEYERTLSADITGNGIVDANDLKQMSGQWLMTESWYVP